MALADLVARLEHEARVHADEILRAAAADVRAIEAATEQAVAEITEREIERGRAERRLRNEHALAVARQRARAGELEATLDLVRRILARARERIHDAATFPAYLAVLPAHVEEALSFLHGVRPRVRCHPELEPVVRPVLEKHDGATLEIDEALGPGVVAETADRSVIVDNTLRARLSRAETRLTIELAARLRHGRP